MRIVRLAACIGAIFAFVGTAEAGPIDFSTSGYSVSGIGADFQTIYDSFTVTGLTGSVSPSSSAPVEIATYAFTVGPNCYGCTQTPAGFTTGFSATIDNQTRSILLPWSWSSTGPVDTLAVGSAVPVTFNLGTEALTLSGLSLGSLSSAGGTVSGDIFAAFNFRPVGAPVAAAGLSNVPEPRSLALFGLGLVGLVALAIRRRIGAAAA